MKEKVIILGGGVAGLAAGYFLSRSDRYEITVIEQSDVVGGMCASFPYKGFNLDYGPHKMYSVLPGILDDLTKLMGERAIRVPKKNKIFLNGVYLEYPLKLSNLLKVTGPWLFLKIGLGFAWQKFLNLFPTRPAQSYEEFMIRTFGKPTYQLIFEPLAEKVWGDPKSLHPDMAKIRVPSLNTFHLLLRLLKLMPENESTNAQYFYYPRAGFGDFPQKLKEEIEKSGGKIFTHAAIKGLQQRENQITGVSATINGMNHDLACDKLISSIPLPQLLSYVEPNKPLENRLAARHLLLVYLIIDKVRVIDDQWVFFPERKFTFSRLSEQKNISTAVAPADKTALCCDFTCEENSPLWTMSDGELIKRCQSELAAAKIIDPKDVIAEQCFVIRKQRFYPRYDLDYLKTMTDVSGRLKQTKNLLSTGRLGMFNYNNSDHCFDMGKFIAEKMNQGRACPVIWEELEQRVRDYKIID